MDLPGENPLIRKCLRVSRTTRFSAPPFAFLGLYVIKGWAPISARQENEPKIETVRFPNGHKALLAHVDQDTPTHGEIRPLVERGQDTAYRPSLKVRARCGSSARRDLCGGHGVTRVPTATQRAKAFRVAPKVARAAKTGSE
jgi:hypothetical protein